MPDRDWDGMINAIAEACRMMGNDGAQGMSDAREIRRQEYLTARTALREAIAEVERKLAEAEKDADRLATEFVAYIYDAEKTQTMQLHRARLARQEGK